MNRRNVLIGLGGLTIGGGALFGTGAFSQVEADRTVTVSTTDDASALLAFDLDSSFNGVGDGGEGSGVLQLNLEQLNDDAVTRFDGVLTVTNNGSQEVELSVSNVPAALTLENDSETDIEGNPQTIGSSNDLVLTIEVDLVNESVPADQDITFDAQSTA